MLLTQRHKAQSGNVFGNLFMNLHDAKVGQLKKGTVYHAIVLTLERVVVVRAKMAATTGAVSQDEFHKMINTDCCDTESSILCHTVRIQWSEREHAVVQRKTSREKRQKDRDRGMVFGRILHHCQVFIILK